MPMDSLFLQRREWCAEKILSAFHPELDEDTLRSFIYQDETAYNHLVTFFLGQSSQRIYVCYRTGEKRNGELWKQLTVSHDNSHLMADRACYFVRTREPGISIDPDVRVDTDLLFGEIVKAALTKVVATKNSNSNKNKKILTSLVLRAENKAKDVNNSGIKLFKCSVFVPKRVRWMATQLYEYFSPELDSETLDVFFTADKTAAQIQKYLGDQCMKYTLYLSFSSGIGPDGQVWKKLHLYEDDNFNVLSSRTVYFQRHTPRGKYINTDNFNDDVLTFHEVRKPGGGGGRSERLLSSSSSYSGTPGKLPPPETSTAASPTKTSFLSRLGRGLGLRLPVGGKTTTTSSSGGDAGGGANAENKIVKKFSLSGMIFGGPSSPFSSSSSPAKNSRNNSSKNKDKSRALIGAVDSDDNDEDVDGNDVGNHSVDSSGYPYPQISHTDSSIGEMRPLHEVLHHRRAQTDGSMQGTNSNISNNNNTTTTSYDSPSSISSRTGPFSAAVAKSEFYSPPRWLQQSPSNRAEERLFAAAGGGPNTPAISFKPAEAKAALDSPYQIREHDIKLELNNNNGPLEGKDFAAEMGVL